MPGFFPIFETLLKCAFWYRQQLLFRFFFYLLNRSNTSSIHRWLQFCEERKKSTGAKSGEYGCWAMVTVLFLAKNSCTKCAKSKIFVVFPQFCAFLTNCIALSAYNFKVVFLSDRTTLWQEFIVHHAIAIEENSEWNLHICPNLMCFFRSWLFWTLPLGWLGFGFNIIAIHPWFVTSKSEQIWIVVERCKHLLTDVHAKKFNVQTIHPWFVNSYELSEQIWIVVERRQHPLSDVYATSFSNFETIFDAARFMPKKFLKMGWHEPNDMPTSLATLSNSDSSIIQNHFLYCFKLVDATQYYMLRVFTTIFKGLGLWWCGVKWM